MKRIAIIEDDPQFGHLIKLFFEEQGFRVDWFVLGQPVLEMAHEVDICLIDINLPGENGFEIAKKLHAKLPKLPLIFLTARGLKEDQLKGFAHGADDYLVKPVDPDLLLAKVHAVLKRSITQETSHLQFEDVSLTEETFLKIGDISWQLTKREGKVLGFVIRHAGQVVDRMVLLNRIWGSDDFFSGKSLDVFMTRIRKKLEHSNKVRLKTIRGKGYILDSQ